MGLAEILFVVFLVLKLVGIINWSWLVVTAPLWGVYSTLLLGIVLIGLSSLFRHPR